MASFSTIATIQTDVTDIKAKTDNLPVDPADQSAVEGAITTAHSTTDGKIDAAKAVVDAIKAKTDNLPAAPAAAGDVTTAHATTDGKVDAAKAVVDAIKTKTDALPTDPADQSAVEGAITTAHSTTDGKIDAVSAKIAADPATKTTGTWTPAAGKKFRLNAYEITADVTAAGTIVIKDGSTVIKTFQAGIGNFAIARNLLANGYLSAAANNALTCDVDTATATIQANWEGSEE